CKSSSASSNRPGYYNIKQLERKIIGRSHRFGRSGLSIKTGAVLKIASAEFCVRYLIISVRTENVKRIG
ncbi:MAG: hypothetical protein WBI57_12660, partial [Desulfobacterales bacterium]